MGEVLYHFTSKFHLPKILNSGFLKLTESNLKKPASYEDALPKTDLDLYKPVVWLTKAERGQGNGLDGSSLNKCEIRITIHKREHYEPWVLWSDKNRIQKSWAKTLARAGNPYDWYVAETVIPLNDTELIRIENTVTGEIIINLTTGIREYQVEIIKPTDMPIQVFDNFYSDTTLKMGDIVKFSL